MEPQTKTANPAPAVPPVMDVTPPQVHAEPAADKTGAAAPAPQPKAPDQPAPQPPRAPKQHNSSLTLAIVATVIIVLGLGLLATLAYLKQNS